MTNCVPEEILKKLLNSDCFLETRPNGTHFAGLDYGYFDLTQEEYDYLIGLYRD